MSRSRSSDWYSGRRKIVPIDTRTDCRQNGSWHRSPRTIASAPKAAAMRTIEPMFSTLVMSGQITSVSRSRSFGTTASSVSPGFRRPQAMTPEWNFIPRTPFITSGGAT